MSKTTLIAVLAVGTAGVVGAGLPYYTGVVAERQFQKAFDEVSSHPLMSARPTAYERGWFSSEAGSELTVRVGEHVLVFPCRHSISHGLASARVTTLAELPEDVPEELRSQFGEAFVTAVTTVRPNGDQYTELQSPAVEAETPAGDRLQWGGFTGKVVIEGERLESDLQLPHFRLSAEQGSMGVEDMVISGELERFSKRVWLGDSRFGIAHVEMDVPLPEEDGARSAFRISDIEVVQTQREDGPDMLGFEMEMKVGEVAPDGAEAWKNFAWEASMRNIDKAAYLGLVDRLASLDATALAPEDFSLQMAQMIGADAEAFLQRSPQLNFKRISITGPDGDFEGDVAVGFNGEGQFAYTGPELLNRMSVQAHVRMPKPMLEQILGQAAMGSAQVMTEEYPEATEAEIADLAEEIQANQLTELQNAGLLVADGDDYTVEASYAQGYLEVNGVPMNGLLGQ